MARQCPELILDIGAENPSLTLISVEYKIRFLK